VLGIGYRLWQSIVLIEYGIANRSTWPAVINDHHRTGESGSMVQTSSCWIMTQPEIHNHKIVNRSPKISLFVSQGVSSLKYEHGTTTVPARFR
jgi:hypothetical protein